MRKSVEREHSSRDQRLDVDGRSARREYGV
jgi:hypothetical protein